MISGGDLVCNSNYIVFWIHKIDFNYSNEIQLGMIRLFLIPSSAQPLLLCYWIFQIGMKLRQSKD
jgi:hypothetical protein